MILANREAGFCIDNGFQEATTLLPGSYHQRYDGSPTKESNEQIRSRKTIDPMGRRAQ